MACRRCVAGNLKYDIAVDTALLERSRAWPPPCPAGADAGRQPRGARKRRAAGRLGRQPAPRPQLLIVPRHPQRFDEWPASSRRRPSLSRRSSWSDAPRTDADVWLGDSMREMPLYYGLARVALLGGSFEPWAGKT